MKPHNYSQDVERLMARIDVLEAEARILSRKPRRKSQWERKLAAGRRMWQHPGESNSLGIEFRCWQRLSLQEQEATRAARATK